MNKFKLFRLSFATALLSATRPLVGGQAVIEGVMMRSPNSFAVAIRRPDKQIVVHERKWLSFAAKFPFLKWPVLRGATMLVESMYNGMAALQFSAEQAMTDEEQAKAGNSKSTDRVMMFTMFLSMIAGIALFKMVPHLIAFGLGQWLGRDGQSALPMTSVGFHLVDGIVKLSIFTGYILLISRFEEVRRLFMYHGAEHKAVHAFEKQLALDVEQTRIQSTAHPRCGTSLILLVISLSIVVFAITLPFIPQVSENAILQSLFGLAIKIPLMLPIAGIAYEFQRAAAKHPNNFWIKLFISPGMLMQRLTTTEPTDDQLEVSLTALRKTIWREQLVTEAHVAPARGLEVFGSFSEVCQKVA